MSYWLLSPKFTQLTIPVIKKTAGLCTIGSSSTVEMNFATPLVSGCRAKAGKGVPDWVTLGEQYAQKEHVSQWLFWFGKSQVFAEEFGAVWGFQK